MKRILFHLLVLAQQKLNSERRGSKTVIDDYDEKGLLTLLFFLEWIYFRRLEYSIIKLGNAASIPLISNLLYYILS